MKILICGYRSFAAGGVVKRLLSDGHDVDCFTRGDLNKTNNEISGDVFNMTSNIYLKDVYDIVINYIFIKNEDEEENLRYARALHEYCSNNARTLIHISSVSVYPNNSDVVNERSPIENDSDTKGKYAATKLAVDNFFMEQQKKYNLIFLRPGYIVEDGMSFSSSGIAINLPFNVSILLGDKKTALPLIDRNRMNEAISRIVLSGDRMPCYLLSENRRGTKYQYLQFNKDSGIIISLPSKLVVGFSSLLFKLRLLNKKRYHQVKGLFKRTVFDSSATEENLCLSMTNNSICIVGAGVYGSYTIDAIKKKSNSAKLTLIDVGDEHIKNERDIGYSTNIITGHYTGLSDGRYFGLGGTSNKWGGQILLFSDNDFSSPNKFLLDLIEISNKYKNRIFKKFGIIEGSGEISLKPKYPLFIKTGIWLGYFRRNLYKYFRLNKDDQLLLMKRARLVDFIHENKEIKGARIYSDGEIKRVYYDRFILCTGAFESNRILLQSGLLNCDKISFSDHLSNRVFKIKGKPKIGPNDFQFSLVGNSLMTKRLIGEVNGYSYFANPVYNANFPFFGNLKKVLFKGQRDIRMIKDVLLDIPNIIKFGFYMIFKRKIYVYKNEWFLYIDIENPVGESTIQLSESKDKFGINGLDISFDINQQLISSIYNEAIKEVRELLIDSSVTFEQMNENISAEKLEDTYHPYAMALSDSNDLQEYLSKFKNLIVFNTGVLPRAGGINTTAALFPAIEYYVDNLLFENE